MTWGAIGSSVAGAVVGGMMSGDASGGTQTASKEPWAEAAPWLKQNIKTGQDLQGYYQNNLFNQQQQDAYGNLSGGTAYMNQLIPGLIAQLSGQQGFDRGNPLARPQPLSLPPATGFFGQRNPVNMNQTNNPFANGGIQAPAAPPAPAAPGTWQPQTAWEKHVMAADPQGGMQFLFGQG